MVNTNSVETVKELLNRQLNECIIAHNILNLETHDKSTIEYKEMKTKIVSRIKILCEKLNKDYNQYI